MTALLVAGSLLIAVIAFEVLEGSVDVNGKLMIVGISGIGTDEISDMIAELVDAVVVLMIGVEVVLIGSVLELRIVGIVISGVTVVLKNGGIELGIVIEG